MIDIVDFWKQQTEKWNDEQKCGFCWSFGAPLTESAANGQQTEDPCCVSLFVTNVTQSTVRGYANTGFQNSREENHGFVLYVLKRDGIGVNNYNEMLGHPIEESKWETILKPLKQCVTEENVLEFCEILGINLQIPNWNMETKINWLDENYTGWMVRATFKEKIQ